MASRLRGSDRPRQLVTAAHRLFDRTVNLSRRFIRNPRPVLAHYVGFPRPRQERPAPRPAGETISPAVALRENGFTVARGLIPPDECARIAAELKAEMGVRDGHHHSCVDATRKVAAARELVFDERILAAVRAAIGPGARFLQVSDLQYHHDTANWHRDSVHRAAENRLAPDWDGSRAPYRVVKALVYLESDNAAMGMMSGSHASKVDIDDTDVYSMERRHWHKVIGFDEEPNRRFTPNERRVPFVWTAGVGDMLIFDERMYHCGRRVEDGKVTRRRTAPKFTLSLVFGADNEHSVRMYSYFRFVRRELGYRNLPKDFRQELRRRGLVLSHGWRNYYADHPDELRLVHLRNRSDLEKLVAEFSGSAKGG